MPIESVPALIRALRESRSLRPAQLEEVAGPLQGQFHSARLLAKELLTRGWLTAYQINQLFQGRGPRLRVGPYVILERLGEGGMGQVFKAWHCHMDRVVALKVVRKDRLENPEAVRRFQREIEVVARLSHPNIVRAYDADEVDGTRFIALEYVEGTDLGRLVKQSGPLPVEQACDYVRQASLGLQHAFERGLVHRDIKPSNLLVTRATPRTEAGVVKILDMGLARLQGPQGDVEALTQAQATLGTPDFIAPEQARDARSADIRADLYSLGCTFYFLLAGRVPFPGSAPMEKLLKHWMEQPTPVEQLRPDVDSEIVAIIRRLMAKQPEARYQTPIELVAALASLNAAANGTSASPASPLRPKTEPMRPAGVPTPIQETIIPSSLEDTDEGPIIRVQIRKPSRNGQVVQFVIASVAVAAITILLVFLLRG